MESRTYVTTIGLPETVSDYFKTLARFGTVAYTPGWSLAKVALSGGDLYDLALTVRDLQTEVGRVFGTPVDIPRPRLVEDDTYAARVPLSEDVNTFFGILTGLAAADFNPSENTVGLRIEATDEYDLATTVAEIAGELAAYFPGEVDIPRPVLAA